MLTALARGSSQAAQLTIVIVAARFLSPAEFGVIALVAVIALMVLGIAEAGSADFIVSWQGNERVIDACLVLGVLAGAVVALGGVALAYATPLFGHVTSDLVALSALWTCIAIVASGQGGLLVRAERVELKSAVVILSEVIGITVALLSLFRGQGVLSLIYGKLAQQGTELVVLSAINRRLPIFVPSHQLVRPVVQYCQHILATRALSVTRASVAPLLVGAFLGPAAVGLYRAGERLIGAFAEVVGEPVRMVAWLLFRRAARIASFNGQPVTSAISSASAIFLPVVLALAVPAFILVGIFADELVVFLLGEPWRGAGAIAAVLAVARLLTVPASITDVVLSLTGQIKRLPRVSLINCIVAIGVVAITAQFGVLAVAYGEVFAGLIAFGTSVWLQSNAGVNWAQVARLSAFVLPALAVAIAVALTAWWTIPSGQVPEIVRAVLSGFASLCAYCLVILAVRPKAMREVLTLWIDQRAAVRA
ncbi:MAG: oligosaccharide flippase family protein [Pseudomonadota bacterium]